VSDTHYPLTQELTQAELAHQQALKYGRDLARVFVAEKAKRQELQIAYQALRAIFASIPDGVVVLDDAFTVQQGNPAFALLVEMTPESIIGQPLSDVLVSDELLPALEWLTADETVPTQIELNVLRPVKRSLLATIARLRAGRLQGWIVVLRDQSERKRLEYQKAEFINIAAHELRTPLAFIGGFSELLLENLAPKLDQSNLDLLRSVISAAQRLQSAIDELLQFAELNHGDAHTGGISEFLLSDLIQDVASDLQPRADEKLVSLQVTIPDPKIRMVADPALLRSALRQLVLNGINFNTALGSVRIGASQTDDQVTIRVVDSGIGIPQADLKMVLQPFFQVEDHNVRRVGGLGLGLSIARSATEQLGGVLSVESALNQGTTFTLHLPVRQPSIDAELQGLQARLEASRRQSMAYAHDIKLLYQGLKEANKELQEANLQLEEADKLKTSFLGVVSHELRSPFVSIDLALQTFPRYGLGHLNAEQHELWEQLTRSFEGARRMIDGLVAYAGLLSKQGRLNLEPVNIAQQIDEIAFALGPMAESRGLDLKTQVPVDLTLPAGDRDRIGEALWHLVHNAIKFTTAGGQVVVRAWQEHGRLIVEVQDTGVGIPAEQQAKIWESFAQLSDPLRRGVDGLGLGLALVRYVAAAHGGDVALRSEPGVGSVFSFWLPVAG
jgi:PAS domain S-box-containing protein